MRNVGSKIIRTRAVETTLSVRILATLRGLGPQKPRRNEMRQLKEWVGFKHLRGSQFLDAKLRQPLAHVNRIVQALTLHDTGRQTARKRVTGAVGVVDQGVVDGVHRVLLDLVLALDGDKGWLSAVGDDSDTLSLLVLLGQVGHKLSDFLEVLRRMTLRLGPGLGFSLVADDVVPVRSAGVERLLEELSDEGGGKREDEDLVLCGGLLGELHDGRRAH